MDPAIVAAIVGAVSVVAAAYIQIAEGRRSKNRPPPASHSSGEVGAAASLPARGDREPPVTTAIAATWQSAQELKEAIDSLIAAPQAGRAEIESAVAHFRTCYVLHGAQLPFANRQQVHRLKRAALILNRRLFVSRRSAQRQADCWRRLRDRLTQLQADLEGPGREVDSA
jgi:hypothetical protein